MYLGKSEVTEAQTSVACRSVMCCVSKSGDKFPRETCRLGIHNMKSKNGGYSDIQEVCGAISCDLFLFIGKFWCSCDKSSAAF